MSRYAFAQRSGLGIAQILDLEKASSNPTLATLTRLATALGLTLQELVTPEVDSGEMVPGPNAEQTNATGA